MRSLAGLFAVRGSMRYNVPDTRDARRRRKPFSDTL